MGLGQLGCQGAPDPGALGVHWSAWRAVVTALPHVGPRTSGLGSPGTPQLAGKATHCRACREGGSRVSRGAGML